MLAEDISSYVADRHAAIVKRFFPDWKLPGFFAGYAAQRHDVSDFLYNLASLHQLGYREIADAPIERAMVTMLKQVHAPSTRTFWSYRIAEALAAFGPWDDNPLLAQLTAPERENIAAAIDSTSIYDPAEDKLRGLPNNYWGVLARCEFARQRLDVLQDTTVLDRCVAKAEQALFASGSGHMDDDVSFAGRYDIYSPDTLLFLEPLWHRFDQAKLKRNLLAATQLIEKCAMENGACIGWGRSIGAMSVCLTLESCAAAVKLGLASDAGRSMALARNAFEQFKGWIADDLISAHRYRHTYRYRGPQRLVGMTLDCFGKLLYAAKSLTPSPGTPAGSEAQARRGEGSGVAAGEGQSAKRKVPPAAGPLPNPPPEYRERGPEELFPPIDELIKVDDQGAGVWLFRNEKLSFQLPITAYAVADYVPWLHSPGMFENPVDSDMIVGVPRLIIGDEQYTISGRASSIEKLPNGIVLRYDDLKPLAWNKPAGASVPAKVEIHYRVERETVHGQIAIDLPMVPDAVTFDILEALRPLAVHIEGGDRVSVVDVEGIPPYRSFWGELRRWHQTQITPSKSIRLKFTLRPALRVLHVPTDSDYNRSLYDVLPKGEVIDFGPVNGTCYTKMDVAGYCGDSDIVHIGWPEHLFASHGLPVEEFDKRLYAFFEKLAQSGKKIVWTMHNRIPHAWEHERGHALYRALAPQVDGVIHHSHCGMKKMLAELPYKPTAKHVVIPHGHFGAIMPKLDRAMLEKKYGLSPVPIRFGMLGRPQKEKQFGMVLRAFIDADREDQEMLITVNEGDRPPVEHPRVKTVTRVGFLTRDIVSEHNQLVDVLVSAHTGETYLTSGIPADAIGLGQAMFVPEWDYFHEHLGDAAVYHDNTEATLTKLFREFTVEQMRAKQAAMSALQERYDQRRLAEQMLEFFRSL